MKRRVDRITGSISLVKNVLFVEIYVNYSKILLSILWRIMSSFLTFDDDDADMRMMMMMMMMNEFTLTWRKS